MRVETALAKSALDAVARRDPSAVYHKMTPAEMQTLTPAFDWTIYFKTTGAPPIETVNVTEPEFFKAFKAIVTATRAADPRTYLREHMVHASTPMLSAPLVADDCP